MKKKTLAGSLIDGVFRSFPLAHTIKKIAFPPKAEDGTPDAPKHDRIAIIVEVAIVALIAAFVFGKISMEQLLQLIGLLQ